MAAYTIFISYAHEDEALKNALTQQLAGLKRSGLIDPWDDRCIDGGEEWRGRIDRAIDGCQLALLLVSAAFIASDFIYADVLSRLLERREQDGIRVVPIIVKPCAWKHEQPIASLKPRPKDAKAIITFPKETGARAQAWLDIVNEIAGWAREHAAALSGAERSSPGLPQDAHRNRASEAIQRTAFPSVPARKAAEPNTFTDHCVINPRWLAAASQAVENPPPFSWHRKIEFALGLVEANADAIDDKYHRLPGARLSDDDTSIGAHKRFFFRRRYHLAEVVRKSITAYDLLLIHLRDAAIEQRTRALHTFAAAASLWLVKTLQSFEGKLVTATDRVVVRLFPDLPSLKRMMHPIVGLPYQDPINGLAFGYPADYGLLHCRISRGDEGDYEDLYLPRRDAETFQEERPGPPYLYWGWVVPEWLLYIDDSPPAYDAWWITVLSDELNRERRSKHRESPWDGPTREPATEYDWPQDFYERAEIEPGVTCWVMRSPDARCGDTTVRQAQPNTKEPPMLLTRIPEPDARRGLQKIAGCDEDARLIDIVFIHGLGGDAWTTWMADKDDIGTFWPNWIAADLPQAGLWTLGYAASGSKWQEESMPLADRGNQVLDLLSNEGLGERPLAFVTHSMGGIVAKQILRHAESFGVDRWEAIAKQTKGIAFIATPHSGAHVANFAELAAAVYRTNEHVKELSAHDPRLRELHGWFLKYQRGQSLICRTYCERRELRPEIPLLGIKLPKGILVVDETSAEPNIPGERAVPLDEDHISICKPDSRDAQLYKGVVRFLKDCLAAAQVPR